MSYSLESIFNSASWAISNHSLALFKLQEQASTGQEINRPSDDSQQAYQILGLRDDVRSITTYDGLDSLSEYYKYAGGCKSGCHSSIKYFGFIHIG